MSQIAVQTQIDAIREVSRKILQSKEKSAQFLKSAGILKQSSSSRNTSKKEYTAKKK